jgi:dihydroorotate dehydrogenase (NAD+) catalytic subunit
MMEAGASAVGIGSAIYYRGIDVFSKVCEEMKVWMKENGYKSVKELVGIAHE